MSNVLVAFFMAAGVAAFAYSRLGRRVGYGNSQKVWVIVAISFVITFIVVLTLVSTLLNIH